MCLALKSGWVKFGGKSSSELIFVASVVDHSFSMTHFTFFCGKFEKFVSVSGLTFFSLFLPSVKFHCYSFSIIILGSSLSLYGNPKCLIISCINSTNIYQVPYICETLSAEAAKIRKCVSLRSSVLVQRQVNG